MKDYLETYIESLNLWEESQSNLFVFNLQRFAGEKTEEPTERRKQEVRQQGQVAKSAELGSVFVILAAFLTMKALSSYLMLRISGYMTKIYGELGQNGDFTLQSAHMLILNAGMVFMEITMPILLSVLVVSIVVGFLQVGFMFNLEPLMPRLSRINPISGFGRIFSKRSIVELVKSMVKISIVMYFIYRFLNKEMGRIPGLIQAELGEAFVTISELVFDLATQIALVLLIIAIFDYAYQWWEHMQDLKMSKEEVKEEMKQTEGNPQIRSKIREKQRAMAMRRMMQEVPKADVIVTNPTHFSVALKYESEMEAPVVIAKGIDFIALRIREIAKENDVVVVENKPLAQALYKSTEVGDIIPPDLYKAVAEVLAYVYRLKRKFS